jgi:choice-of-anchor B domain-containing protein
MFKKRFTFILLLSHFTLISQISNNIDLLKQWDDNSLTKISGLAYNDIWGYTDENCKEYGILGSIAYTHFIALDTTGGTLQEIARVAGKCNSIWRDFKTYGHYAYGVADNCSSSLQIFDLSELPTKVTKVYDSAEFFTYAHNIYIDEANARLYVVGSKVANVIVLDLKNDPTKPTLLKNVSLPRGYVHDLYVRDHIAYCSHVYDASLYVYDLKDLDNVTTLGALTEYVDKGLNHSNWLSDDGEVLTLTDETRNTAVKVLDVRDLTDINVLSTFKSTLEAPVATNSIPHNSFIVGNDYVVVSYYHEGIQIYDIQNRTSPVKAGYYDTEPNNTNYSGSKGSWGVYPFFPSGNIIASDIDNGLFLLQPNFPLRKGIENDLLYTKVLESDTVVSIMAKNSISMAAGFHAKKGAKFSAKIDPCLMLTANPMAENIQQIAKEVKDAFPNIKKEQNKVYPNPFTSKFRIKGNELIKLETNSILISDNLGRILNVRKNDCGENCIELDLSGFPNGYYTLIIKGEKIQALKIVKYKQE